MMPAASRFSLVRSLNAVLVTALSFSASVCVGASLASSLPSSLSSTHGRPGTLTDANGLATTLTYDARGRLKTSTAGTETMTYDYDGVGDLAKLTLPDGTFLSCTYDAAERLTSIADCLGNSVTYTLDGLGNRTKEDTRDPSGALVQTLSRAFDGLSRVQTMTGATSQVTSYTYDDEGNLRSATAAWKRRGRRPRVRRSRAP
jgi:YD repeat-containing protein